MRSRRSLVEVVAVSSVLVLCLATIAALVDADARRTRESLGQHQNVTKLQARISLESRNFDIDNEKSVNISGGDKNGESQSATIKQQPQETRRDKNMKRKRERSERKLSNLWSMFLPGSSSSVSESDYEDNGAGSDESSEDGSGEVVAVTVSPSHPGITIASNTGNNLESKSKPLAEMANLDNISNADEHSDERLILAKYSRPPRQDGTNSTDSVNSNAAAATGRGSGDHQSGGTNQVPSTADDRSAAPASLNGGLITGALSRDIGASSNDGAPNTTNGTLNVDSLGPVSSSNEMGEREDDDRPSVNARGNNINNRTTSADNNFERWLNRIQFQEPPVQSSATPTSASTGDPQPSHKNASQARPFGSKRLEPNLTSPEALGGTKTTELTRLIDGLAEVRLRQQQQQQPQHGKQGNQRPRASPMSLINSQRLASIQQQQIKVDEHIAHQSKFQHPFQQQLKQNQAQLIQGIKYPMVAQASTISVSTQDGSSNTTNMTSSSPNNEISSIVATTQQTQTQSPGAGNEESQPVQQQVVQEYQSQDEILRQVTSAINFEQQLSNKKPARPDGSNHRKTGESLGTSSSEESPDSNPKLFNEFVDTPLTNTQTQAAPATASGSTTSPMELLKASMSTGNGGNSSGSNGNSSMIGTNDLDKNLDMLAEKLRLIVAQRSQQQLTNSQPNGSQPSWLRRPDPVAAINQANKDLLLAGGGQANLTSAQLESLMNVSGNRNFGASSSVSLDKLRDLLSKHEKNKNELKNSQETMNLLLQQLMQDEAEKSQSNRDNNKSQQQQQQTFNNNHQLTHQLVRGESTMALNLPGQQQQVDRTPNGVTNIGWTPLTNGALHQVAPVSPANLIKGGGRFKKPPMRISQMLDNSLGGGSDFANGDHYMNDLAMMLASSGHPSDEANELLASHKILGVPVAFLKEDEEEAQFEAAAKHLAGHDGRQLPNLRPAKNQITQRLASSSSSSPNSVGQQQKSSSLGSHHLALNERIKASHPLQHHGETSNMEAMAGPFPNTGQLLIRGNGAPIEMEQYHHHPHNQYASLLHEHAHHHQQENQNPFIHTQSSIVEPQVLPDSLTTSNQDILMGKQQQQHHGKMGTAATVGVEQQNQQRVPVSQEQQAQQVVAQQVAAAHPGDSETTQAQATAQQQQPQQKQNEAAGLIGNQNYHHNSPQSNSHAYQTKIPGTGSVGLGQEMSQLVGSQRLAPLAVLGAGTTPIRYREVSIYRPFGYQSHHAIAYQASPTVAALFPGLAQGSPRPSLLRQMSPFRSRFQENHRLMGGASPLSLGGSQLAGESMRQQQHPALPIGQVRFQSAYQASPLPITAVRQHYIRFGASGGSNQVKRKSSSPIRESWPPSPAAAKLNHRLPYSSQQTKMKPRHLNDIQPPPPPVEFGDSLIEIPDDDDVFSQNLENLNYMSLDSAVKSTIDAAGHAPMQQQQINTIRPTMPDAENKSRPSRQPDNFRQQRGPKWETMTTKDKLGFSQQQRQWQKAKLQPLTKSCITSQPQGATQTQMQLSTLKPISFAITQTPTATPTTTSVYSASSNKLPPATAINVTSTQTTPLAISTNSSHHHPAIGVSSTTKPVAADQQPAIMVAANSTRTEPM